MFILRWAMRIQIYPFTKKFSLRVSLLEKYQASKTLDILRIDCNYDDLLMIAGYTPRVLVTEYNCNFGDEWAVSVLPKPVGHEGEVGWRGDCYYGAPAAAFIMLG